LLYVWLTQAKGDEAMNKKILVPLGQNDRTEELIPYIEKVARPGMKVIFLMRYPLGGIKWPTKEPDTETASEINEMLDYYSWEANLKQAKAEVVPAVKALERKGIEVTVDVYAGSLKKAVRSHAVNGDVHLIMTRAGIAQRIAGFFNGSTSLFDLFKRPARTPVLLIHPGMVA
jgi:nucleotide-binding universal stress UspA family protein